MSRALVLVAALALATGCASSTGTSAPPEEPAPTSAAAPPTESKTSPPAAEDDADARAWLETNYPGVSWYDDIQSIENRSGVHWVETSLPDSDIDRASAICVAMSAYQLEQGEFTGVTVRAASGQRVAWRMSRADTC